MRRLISIVVAIILASPTASLSQPGKVFGAQYPYLGTALADLKKAYYRPGPLKSEDGELIARIACDALVKIDQQDSLWTDLKKLESKRSDYAAAAQKLLTDLGEFTREFLQVELQVLRAEGVPAEFVDDINAWMADARTRLRSTEISSEGIRAQVRKLADAVCAAREQFKQRLQESEIRSKVITIVYGMGGLILVVADASAGIPSGGVALLSTSLGGSMVAAAASKLIEK